MYSRSYNRNTPLTVPRQYSGVAFSRPRQTEKARGQPGAPKPPMGYSPEVEERLYLPGDLPSVNAPIARHPAEYISDDGSSEQVSDAQEKRPAEIQKPRPSFLSSVGALGDDSLMLIALIVLLAGCEGAEDTLILLILLLLLG